MRSQKRHATTKWKKKTQRHTTKLSYEIPCPWCRWSIESFGIRRSCTILFNGLSGFCIMTDPSPNDDFYLRYYVGHEGKFGREFLEFELYPSGKLRYANNSNYKDDDLIRKEVYVSPAVVEEFRRLVEVSEITKVDDSKWKEPDERSTGHQELECKIGSHHIAFTACEIRSLGDIQKWNDPEGLQTFYYLTLDLKALVMALISSHFKARPIPD